MKTTLDINDELLAKAKAASAKERKSLTTLIEEGLRLRLRRRPVPTRAVRGELPVFAGRGGLVEGVDPTSNRALLAAADDDP
jgi:hypothetical protein